ncbi:growth/differentiation factor [Cellulomonas sp. APG4]|uniref:growth/differentiation factor n=1 Tax=Cellulomonas sp. APG4 TaxID=1538656 RepID=UPI00137B79AE|nr:growth/differentiation factor [Cellulomonas sp. APG4]NCT91003.1 growth/differentiation factor [Cellulomonas sp. APG4]
MDLSTLLIATPVVLASSGSDSESSYLGLVFLLSGFLFYGLVRLRYRNSDKRHKHETETRAEVLDLKSRDEFNHSLKGVSNASMRTSNHTKVRGARHG